MQEFLPAYVSPYLLIGYSYGCTLASLAAQHLESRGQDTHLFLIDGASPKCSQEYFQKQLESATRDLVNIVNYAARLSGIDPIQLTTEQFAQLEKISSPLERVDSLKELVLQKTNKPDLTYNRQAFDTYIRIAKNGLSYLINATDEPRPLSGNVKVLITQETASKYGDSLGGWESYAQNVTPIKNETLQAQTHMALTDPANAEIFAKNVEETLRNDLTPLALSASKVRYAINTYKEVSAETLDFAVRLLSEHVELQALSQLLAHASKKLSSHSPRTTRAHSLEGKPGSPLQETKSEPVMPSIMSLDDAPHSYSSHSELNLPLSSSFKDSPSNQPTFEDFTSPRIRGSSLLQIDSEASPPNTARENLCERSELTRSTKRSQLTNSRRSVNSFTLFSEPESSRANEGTISEMMMPEIKITSSNPQ